jgi:hypothetical protein
MSKPSDKIHRLSRNLIDIQQWDATIDGSPHKNIYARSWYLDAISDGQWEAWIYDTEYDIVMPVIPKRKYLLPYFYRPPVCQQLGIYSRDRISQDQQSVFVQLLQQRFVSTDITVHNGWIPDKNSKPLPNHIVGLSPDIGLIRSQYNRGTQRKLIKANQTEHHIKMTADADGAVDFLKANLPIALSPDEEMTIHRLLKAAHRQGALDVFWADTESQHQSIAICMRYDRRVYFLLTAGTPFAHDHGLNFGLIDYMLVHYSASFDTFDFTGSHYTNIAQRNLGFGAIVETYYQYRHQWV